MTKTYDLTKGRPAPLILKFFFPMLLTNMLQQIYTISDTVIVGKGLGDDRLAAVGNMSSLTFLVIGFSIGLTTGFSVVTAQYYGEKNTEGLKRTVASSIYLSVIMSVILTVIGVVSLKPVLAVLQTSEIIMKDSLLYGYIIFGGLTATIAYNLCGGILRALGDSKTPFIAIAVSTVLNIILNWAAVFIFKTGVEGPAAVTVFAQLVSFAICFIKLRRIDIVKLSPEHFRKNSYFCALLLKNGIPMALMNSITAVGCMTVQYFVNGMGVVYTSAYSSCSRYINLFMQPACTAGYTVSTFTSQNYGAKKYDRIAQGFKVCLSIAIISYVLLGAVMVLFPGRLAALMLNGEEQIALTSGFLVRCGIMIITVDCLFVIRSTVQGMGKQIIPMVSGIIEMVMRISVIALFIGKIGFNATAYAEIAAWTGALLINTALLYKISRSLKSDGNHVKMFAIRKACAGERF